jgi:hypothetical protein
MMKERLVKVDRVYFSSGLGVVNRAPMREGCSQRLKTAEVLLQMVITEFSIRWI